MNQLITESLKRGNTRFLFKFTDALLSKTEKGWINWIQKYNIDFGQPPSLDRFSTEFSTSFVVVDSVDPLEDIFLLELKQKKNLVVRAYIQKNIDGLREGDDPSQMIEDLHKQIAVSSSGIIETDTFDRSLYFREVNRIFTGIETMDEATGGINDGDLVYIVGRPQDGKTTFLLHMIAKWFWEGKRILIISNEIPWIDMLFKIDAILAGVSVGEKRSGKWKAGSKEKLKFMQYLSSIAPNKIVIPNKPIRKPSEVMALIQEYKPDVVCIDGAYLMSTTGAATVEWADLAAVSRDLKAIANTTEVPIIGVIQANRGASESQIVTGANIAGSDAFFQDPDIVYSLRHMINGGSNMNKTINLATTKNRHGIFVSVQAELDFENMTMRELETGS